MDSIKLFSGRRIPSTVDTTQRIFQATTYDGDIVLCNLATAKELIINDECKGIKHYWDHKFTTISKQDVKEMPL